MNAPRRDSKWWGWGDPAIEPEIGAGALAVLREEIGELEPASRPGSPDEVELPPARPLPATVDGGGRRGMRSSTGPRTGCATRPAAATRTSPGCARGGSRRRPTPSSCRPTRRQVEALLEACSEAGVAVVPFGGGTSVVGGVEPLRGAHAGLISLDLGGSGRSPPIAPR